MRSLIIAALVASAAPAAALAQAPAAGGLTTATTTIGALIDNPAAKAVVDKHMPGFLSNPQLEAAKGATMKDIQQYAPDQITDKVLADIDADLAKLPKK